jgi:hypothetical protein
VSLYLHLKVDDGKFVDSDTSAAADFLRGLADRIEKLVGPPPFSVYLSVGGVPGTDEYAGYFHFSLDEKAPAPAVTARAFPKGATQPLTLPNRPLNCPELVVHRSD